mmetsp:Transcript_2063/g.3139  ORF Transcript_2063/g.3139 Transcript_2063/m.3139 type:complete len:80 (+) Transcript_2063:46-285(+)
MTDCLFRSQEIERTWGIAERTDNNSYPRSKEAHRKTTMLKDPECHCFRSSVEEDTNQASSNPAEAVGSKALWIAYGQEV